MRYAMLCLVCFSCIFAKEPVDITAILNSNQLLTVDGDTLSLAFIDVPSINSPDSARRVVAQNAVRFLNEQVEKYPLFMEPAHSAQPQIVFLYRKPFLGFESINLLMLQKGLAEIPEGVKAPPLYRRAVVKAWREGAGLHGLGRATEVKYRYGVWLNGGVGIGAMAFAHRRGGRQQYILETGLTIRNNRVNMILNHTLAGWYQTNQIWMLLAGYSNHAKGAEFALSGGPVIHRYWYETEYFGDDPDIPRVVFSNWKPGFAVKIQTGAYFFRTLGMGFNLMGVFTAERILFGFTLNVLCGHWTEEMRDGT